MNPLIKKITCLALAGLLVFSATACGNKEPKEPGKKENEKGKVTVLKANQPVNPTHPYQLGLEKFAELIKEKTDGRYQIDIYHSGQLGDERSSIENLQMGSLDIAVCSTGPMGGFLPDFQVLDFPFLFESYEQADKVLEGPVGDQLLAKLKDLGIVGCAFEENGFRVLTTSEKWGPVKTLDDLKGLKIRTQENEVHMEAFKLLGADPTPMSWSEVFTQLQNGGLDAQENPVPILYNNKINEVQKYVSMTRHLYSPALFLISQKTFDQLSPEDQKIFLECAKASAKYEKEQIRLQEKEQISKLKDLGMVFNEPDIGPFKDAVKPVYEKYQGKFDLEIMKAISAAVQSK